MFRSILLASLMGAVLLLLPAAAHAERPGRGHSMVTVEVGGHQGEAVSVLLPILGFVGAVFPYESNEVGGEVAYRRFLSDQWAVGVSGGYYASSRSTDIPEDDVITTRSFTGRVGVDRYAFIDDNVAVHVGPGVCFASGRWKQGSGSDPEEGPEATSLGLDVRIGLYARLGKGWGIAGQVGEVMSHTSGKNSVGKVSWWSSAHEGGVGLAFDF